MEDFNPKDLVIVDHGTPTEEPAVVYMAGPTMCAVAAFSDGERFIVPKTRLVKAPAPVEEKSLT